MSSERDGFKPEDFLKQLPSHLQFESEITVPEAKAKAEAQRQRLFKLWHKLRVIVDTHEATIRKRWTKVCYLSLFVAPVNFLWDFYSERLQNDASFSAK